MTVKNLDFENWFDRMAAFGENIDSSLMCTQPRPGHADLAGSQKTGATDIRNILERASARETAGRVAAGAIAKAVLAEFGVEVRSFVRSVGNVALLGDVDISALDFDELNASDMPCPDAPTATAMRAEIDKAIEQGDTLGGVITVVALGAIAGVGGYVTAADRLDAQIAGAMMSIPAIKGVEIGEGFINATRFGSDVHDEIVYDAGSGYGRTSNRAGGVEGGMSNGMPIIVNVAMKPIPTLGQPLSTVDMVTKEPASAMRERSDVCAVPAAAVVAEAELAVVLAHAYLKKFGCDSIEDSKQAYIAYRSRIS